MVGSLPIGVLALQGAFHKHQEILTQLGAQVIEVRFPFDLEHCRGLILPGGESTVISKLITENKLKDPLLKFSKKYPVFGTCAGMILMSKGGILDLMEITVKRNAYGRQKSSFMTELTLYLDKPSKASAFFIRAPQIQSIHSEKVRILASLEKEPVLVQQGHHIACAFHPELVNDSTLHEYFIRLASESFSFKKT